MERRIALGQTSGEDESHPQTFPHNVINKILDEKGGKSRNDLEKKARQHKSLQNRKLEDQFEENEGEEPSYAPGVY